ncbi:hypothetical protein APS47_00680 [Leptospira kirschneri serovar Mozdok]|nr:hypothetical protein APS47_00680 [Leptospira kirschneri serovar Mozdok]OOV50477.1 hypothetical protein B1J94_00770 [Leptospira kirschneri serovar Grippotyphosa]
MIELTVLNFIEISSKTASTIHFNTTKTDRELIFQQLYFTKKDQSLRICPGFDSKFFLEKTQK